VAVTSAAEERWCLSVGADAGLIDPRNLTPCSVLQRSENEGSYTVQIRNRYGLEDEERMPQGAVHIVTAVPRQAIKFSDKILTVVVHIWSPHQQHDFANKALVFQVEGVVGIRNDACFLVAVHDTNALECRVLSCKFRHALIYRNQIIKIIRIFSIRGKMIAAAHVLRDGVVVFRFR